MFATGIISEANEYFGRTAKNLSGIEYNRVLKIATGLRNMNLFPDSRKSNEIKSHVTALQAAHLIRVLALNVNPFGDDFEKKVNEWKTLKSADGQLLIHDFAKLLSGGGQFLSETVSQSQDETEAIIDHVHRISFSLDRAFATIVWRRHKHSEDNESDDHRGKAYIERETAYGADFEKRSFERFAIVKRSVLSGISEALQFVGPRLTTASKEAQLKDIKTLEYIETIK